MDSQTAIELLEVARPDSGELEDLEFASAAAHLESCPQCARQFRNLQEFDRNVGRALRDVTVPAGLKEKLLEELQAGSCIAEQSDRLEHPETHSTGNRSGRTSAQSVSRRRHIRYVASAAVCLMAGFVAWWVIRAYEPNTLTLEQFRLSLDSRNFVLDDLQEFDENFEAEVLTDGWRSGRLSFTGPVRGFQIDGVGKHVMALYEFHFGGRGTSPQREILMVIPLSSVEDPPETTILRSNSVRYLPVPNVAWQSNGLVYVCLIPRGDPHSFDLLLRALKSEIS
jgi:hypothetical protein